MQTQTPIQVARGLIDRHGPRAAAFAQAQLEEARLSGDTKALEHWTAVAAATDELRRTGRQSSGRQSSGRQSSTPTRH